ncbi:Crp/Fnr family transcriptional regulator [Pedobacter jejuensis]|uniref:Crp/Fnr family transcriptional regulator n=1 Tax=Pedobacter jejuensis TaxID=1268550 RepID=A0A3N0C1X5_9SPHI|nr:Crp/Fnr family transcriptional regulator [Pedobacter jejuensis]RNL55831.1 Crp/Fnr family transcriptional regulator [Pedobacter jejuensis]
MFKLLESYIKSITEIDEQSLNVIFSKFSLIKVRRNQTLVDYDEVCKHHYFVNKGGIRVYTTNSEGVETTRYFAFEGEFGTALPSLIDQKPAFEYLKTIEKSELLTISRADFYLSVDQIPAFALVYRRILEKGFIIAQKRIYGFQGFSAMEKVIWIKTNQPNFLLKVSNKMAASYLGISPSTLSRIKTKL